MPKEMKRGRLKGVGVSVSITTHYFTTKQQDTSIFLTYKSFVACKTESSEPHRSQ